MLTLGLSLVLAVSRAASFNLLVLVSHHHLLTKFSAPEDRTVRTRSRHEVDGPANANQHIATRSTCPKFRSGKLNVYVAVGSVTGAAVLAYFCVSLILAVGRGLLLPLACTGFCLLPLLADLTKGSRMCRLAWTDRMEAVLEVAAGTSNQMALFGGPPLCLLDWCLGLPMSLSFTMLEFVYLGAGIWIFGYLIRNGKSSSLDGPVSITL